MNSENLVCLEFYADSLREQLVAALDVPIGCRDRALELFGGALCRFRKLNAVEALVVNRAGEILDSRTIWRK